MHFPLCYVLLILLLPFCGYGQKDFDFGFLTNKNQFDVPFTYQGGLIIVKARINLSHSLNLIVDTGAENLILFDEKILEDMDLTVDKEIEIVGTDLETKIDAVICRKVLLSLENTVNVTRDIIVLKENFLDLDQRVGMPIHGLIGGRSFWNLIMTIDYIEQKLTLSKKGQFTPPPPSVPHEVLDIVIEDQKPYLECSFTDQENNEINLKLLIDTGSSLGLLMFTEVDSTLVVSSNYIRGPLGKGLSGDIYGFIGRIPALTVGPQNTFLEVISHFQQFDGELDTELLNERHGLIGNPILSRFKVTIDYLSSKMYLEPNENYDDDFKFDMSGMRLISTGEELNVFQVNSVYENSPAAEADVQKGDIVRRLGFWPRDWLSLEWLSEKLMRKDGRRVRLVLERNGKRLVKKLTLRDYLQRK